MTKLSQEKIDELKLHSKINKRVLHPMGISLIDASFKYTPEYSSKALEDVSNPLTKAEQFNYIVNLLQLVLSGTNTSRMVVDSARIYLFDKETHKNNFPYDRTVKCNGKRFAVNRVIPTHNALSNWPTDTRGKIYACSAIMGGREVNESVMQAAIECIDKGVGINPAATANKVTYVQVSNMVNKVKQFDEFAKEYGDL
ncbi:hypothetical protein PP586_gp59 [Pseudoalteromonas phage vB_PspS-H40/1]|uniref:hypothetical protein n=1 Tax=Pseudoalteromonas phage vB_PspS-H40/1 TaxID=1856120 RepID=UPI0007DD00DC|nr:hypothetical protein PP586_gp59 [Pseudoalteromonas phage vB_PspS-H40/1]ANI22076.1 hypothetical protein H401_59 [Pseudoalteromonas phage vB_PspS-H40/1]